MTAPGDPPLVTQEPLGQARLSSELATDFRG